MKYVREVLGHPEWNPLFDMPPLPDFPSGHSTVAGSFGEILKGFLGNNYHFTDLGMMPRTYNSIRCSNMHLLLLNLLLSRCTTGIRVAPRRIAFPFY